MAPVTRSMSRALLAGPFTLHPKALRSLGVAVPEPEPVPTVTQRASMCVSWPEWEPYTPDDLADYSPM